jgi:hypothetical protein
MAGVMMDRTLNMMFISFHAAEDWPVPAGTTTAAHPSA